jgi:hypothetical protein
VNGIIFSPNNHLREMYGLGKQLRLCRIDIPSALRTVRFDGFWEFVSLNEILFSSNSQLKEIDWSQQCTSLCRVEILSSIDQLERSGVVIWMKAHHFL